MSLPRAAAAAVTGVLLPGSAAVGAEVMADPTKRSRGKVGDTIRRRVPVMSHVVHHVKEVGTTGNIAKRRGGKANQGRAGLVISQESTNLEGNVRGRGATAEVEAEVEEEAEVDNSNNNNANLKRLVSKTWKRVRQKHSKLLLVI